MQQSKKKIDFINGHFKSVFTSDIATSDLNNYTGNLADTKSISHDLSFIEFSQEQIANLNIT